MEEKEVKTCLECGKRLGDEEKFCDRKCQDNFLYNTNLEVQARKKKNSKARYERIKNTPGFKADRRERFKKWREQNHEKHNKFMRDYMRERAKRLYHERREAGLCTRCGKEKSTGYECDGCKSKRRWMK